MKNLKNKKTSEEELDVNINYLQFLTFNISKETYGIDIKHVKEVIEFNESFEIPNVPDYIHGVINLRGEVVPVLDLSEMFYGYKSKISINTSIIIIDLKYNSKNILMGLMIDRVDSVVLIAENNIESIPEFSAKIRSDYIYNIGKVDNKFIVLLNIETLLNIDEIADF